MTILSRAFKNRSDKNPSFTCRSPLEDLVINDPFNLGHLNHCDKCLSLCPSVRDAGLKYPQGACIFVLVKMLVLLQSDPAQINQARVETSKTLHYDQGESLLI